jgi:hypothetical protein
MLKRFNPLLEKSPLNYLYTNYLKRFSKDLDLSNLVFDFSTFMSKDSDNNYLEYNPYNVYLLRSTNQTEDSLLAAWYLVDFLANEGNIYYSTIGDLMPINIKTKQTPDYLEFLENNPFIKKMQELVSKYFKNLSSELISWLTVIVLHAATIPALFAVMIGVTDLMPPIDMTLMIWSALVLMFIKAAVKHHTLNILTIGLGFVIQATLMALIFFK